MQKMIWEKWFPQDWKSDPQLSRCSPATRGIWADAICSMMMMNTYKLEGSADELARDCRCSKDEILTANDDLKKCKAADVSMQKGCITWICRRLARKHNIKLLRQEAANVRWCKPDANTVQDSSKNIMQTPMQTSASASAYASEGNGGVGENPKMNGHSNGELDPDFVNQVLKTYRRDSSSRLSYGEQSALAEIIRERPRYREEFDRLIAFKQKEPRYFPQSLSRLLSNWQETLDRASVWTPDTNQKKTVADRLMKELDSIMAQAQ